MTKKAQDEQEVSLMYVACCKCRTFIDTKPGKLEDISHTLCDGCFEETLSEWKETLEVPVEQVPA